VAFCLVPKSGDERLAVPRRGEAAGSSSAFDRLPSWSRTSLCSTEAMAPRFSKFGTKEEPCYHFANVFDEPPERRGKTVEEYVVKSFGKNPLPTPTGADHWMSWFQEACPANGKALRPKALELLEHLRAHCRDDWHVDTEPDRDFNCSHINVTGAQGHGWHQDGQDYGSLLFLFVVGNSSENVICLGGKDSKDEQTIIMQSGDCLVFEGQTWHAVRKIYPETSPFKDESEWLHDRRMSVLVRQKPPRTRVRRPHYLKK